jgi:hypothetical protein
LMAPAVGEFGSSNQFDGDAKNTILNLIALLAVLHRDRPESNSKVVRTAPDRATHLQ